MEVVAFFTLLAFLPNAADAGRYQECPGDWTQVNVKCYKFGEGSLNRDAASDRCRYRYGATLAVIENKKENKVVQGLIDGNRNAWIGVRLRHGQYKWNDGNKFQFRYANWLDSSRSRSLKCARMLATGYWYPAHCFYKSPYVCSKKADCEPGWTGDECDRKCHCYLGYACNVTETCPYGCETGWVGDMCDKRLHKPTVSFYCVKQRGGYSLMVSLDRNVTSFSNIGAVNAEGEISPECGYRRFQWESRGVLRLKASIQNVSGLLESDCPAETVGKGILKWTFRLQKKKDVVSFEDKEFQVKCDLSEADAVYDDTERVKIEEFRERSLTAATQTRVSVRTYLANPDTLDPVTNLHLGVPVRLVATLPEGDDLVNPFFYPWSCQAASPDGKVTVQLTDDSGCSLSEDIGFGVMRMASSVIQSEVFPMFRLPGYTEVVFSCALVPTTSFRYEVQYCPRRW
ncbi:uncharacterized protein LOC124134610 isoform X2 [Haliotis rufescens]|uniref:uncharacterized protein LOC124134610 isoform X2 n=1 Tax=Haliotis rufescens TaxID=6454 RepID=UPI00201F9652|nr:uncharacterized protein LOC124134610 isoform X2 [Haliotis rufescens]